MGLNGYAAGWHAAPRTGARPALGAWFGGLLAGVRQRRACRRDRRHLLGLEERLLDDVGLTREMVRSMDFSGRRTG